MKTTLFLKIAVMSVIFVNPILSYAESSATYDCIGMDSYGEKIKSSLKINSTNKEGVYNTVWTYKLPQSTPDEGIAHDSGKNRMTEKYKSKTGLDSGESQFYKVSDKELLLHHTHFDKNHKVQFVRTGYCQKSS